MGIVLMKCSLCGLNYDEQTAQASCQSCPVTKGCRLVRCPNCGYETPPEPRWLKTVLGTMSSLLKGRGAINCAPTDNSPFSLIYLPLHQTAEVTSLQTRDSKKLQKLIAIGVFPGMKLALIQKFPSYVFQIGHSQFVIDHQLAESILCQPITD